ACNAQRVELAASQESLPTLKVAADTARTTLADATEKLHQARAAAGQCETVAAQLQHVDQALETAQAVSIEASGEAAATRAAAAVAKVEALTHQAAACRDALTAAKRSEANAGAAAKVFFTDLDFGGSDAELLLSLTQAATEAASTYEAAGRAVAAKAAQVSAE